jgi:peptide/nickel transport system permease protein
MVPEVARDPTYAVPGGANRPAGNRLGLAAVARQPLVGLLTRRLVMAAALLFVVTALSFVLVSLTPGDAARAVLGLNAPPGAYERLRHQLGLDVPLPTQYVNWVSDAIRGDFGSLLFTNESVSHAIAQRLPPTLSLMFGALLVSVLVGVALGVFSAVRGGILGRVVDTLALVGFAVPAFWLGALLISWFAVSHRWLPATGYVSFEDSPDQWLRSLVLPVAALSLGAIAAIAKQTREAMLDSLGSEYIRMAWANGVSARSIYFRHALKNAGVRVLTITGLQAVGLLGGIIVIENVFRVPGLGSLAVEATNRHDLPLIQGIVVYFTVIVIVINLTIDIAYSWLNPKVRTS